MSVESVTLKIGKHSIILTYQEAQVALSDLQELFGINPLLNTPPPWRPLHPFDGNSPWVTAAGTKVHWVDT